MCFVCACMNVTTQLELCLHEQTQILINAACKVGSQTSQRFAGECFSCMDVTPTQRKCVCMNAHK